MRKLLTLTLAVAMVLSLASVAFAAKNYVIDPNAKYAHESNSVVQAVDSPLATIGYGKVAYIKLDMGTAGTDLVNYDDAKELKVKPQWTQNADLVEKVSVVKKRTTTGYSYFIAVAIKAKDTTATAEIAGKIELSVKSGNTINTNGSGTGNEHKLTINPFITVGYGVANVTDGTPNFTRTTYTFGTSDKIFEFGTSKNFDESEDFVFTLNGEAGEFTVNTIGQGKLLLSSSVQYNEGLEAIYPDANYVYINGNGKSFNKTGELKLWADEGEFLYQVKGDKLVKLNAEYNDVEEAFIIKTRTLGTYVIAETELDLTAQAAPEAPAEEVPAPVNPGTGAAA